MHLQRLKNLNTLTLNYLSSSREHFKLIEDSMPGRTLAVLGSGPGIGVAVARAFSVGRFKSQSVITVNKC